jgi:pseudouridine-5'-phosphate glycosidase
MAAIVAANRKIQLNSGILIAVPIPKEFEAPEIVEKMTQKALKELQEKVDYFDYFIIIIIIIIYFFFFSF